MYSNLHMHTFVRNAILNRALPTLCIGYERKNEIEKLDAENSKATELSGAKLAPYSRVFSLFISSYSFDRRKNRKRN